MRIRVLATTGAAFCLAASLYAQGPPIDAGSEIPVEIPAFDDPTPPGPPGPAPQPTPPTPQPLPDIPDPDPLPQLPNIEINGNGGLDPVTPTPIRNGSSTGTSINGGKVSDVPVEPTVSVGVDGQPAADHAGELMKTFHFEALFSSQVWSQHWNSPDFGVMRVTSLVYAAGLPRGGILKWQRDTLGNPMVYLKAKVTFPRLRKPDAITSTQPLGSVPIVISQAVVFFRLQDGGWMASSSPLYVTLEEPGRSLVMVPVERGQGVWRARVGQGGIYIENFVGAGLAAARTQIYEYFRDEEVNLFLQGNSDVTFYLRKIKN